jgi:hypothetical protein
VAELFQAAMNTFARKDAQVVPPSHRKEFAATRTAKKVENKPGGYPDQAEKHKEWEQAGNIDRVVKIEAEHKGTEWQ